MANPKNTAELAELKEKFAEADSLVLTEYRGLTVGQLQQLRGDMGFDVEYHVPRTPSSRSLLTSRASRVSMIFSPARPPSPSSRAMRLSTLRR